MVTPLVINISANAVVTVWNLQAEAIFGGGRELAERLVSERPNMKVLYMSGYTDDAVVHRGVQVADTAFLQKPFTSTDLAGKVREVLDAPAKR